MSLLLPRKKNFFLNNILFKNKLPIVLDTKRIHLQDSNYLFNVEFKRFKRES